MKADKPRSVNNFGESKFKDVESTSTDYMTNLKDNLNEKDEHFNNFDPTDLGFEVKPTWSTVQLKIIDERVSNKKSAGGIIVIEDTSKLPYIWAEILAVGARVGFDSLANIAQRFETFEKGDIVMCLEKNVSFIYLDNGPHSEYYEHDRPYIATIPDKYILLKRVS